MYPAEVYRLSDIMLIPVRAGREGVKLAADFVGGFGWEKPRKFNEKPPRS